MAEVALRQVVKKYGDVEAVRSIDLDIPNNEFVVLVGPSGCGKSTTLRMIAGLEEITSGDISIGGEVVNDLPPKDRDIAMVFQNYALYPHMTAYENMAFGLKLRKFPKAEIKQRVEHAARILDITELLERRPKALSGGQRQRVAMGRAIVRNPKVFLFDEPLSNLDAKLRVQMRTEIKRVHQKVKTTTVYVTHDQVEAMTLADRVVVMNNGRIEQIGAPQELYHNPKTRFVAGFIGSPAMNFIPCTLEKNGADSAAAHFRHHRAARPGKPCGALSAGRRQASHPRPASRACHRAAPQRRRRAERVRGDARRGRADGHGDDGVLHHQRRRILRAGRAQCRRASRRHHAAQRQHGPNAPHRPGQRRGDLAPEPGWPTPRWRPIIRALRTQRGRHASFGNHWCASDRRGHRRGGLFLRRLLQRRRHGRRPRRRPLERW